MVGSLIGIVCDIEDGDELLLQVFDHLDPSSSARLASSSKKFKGLWGFWYPWRSAKVMGDGSVCPKVLSSRYTIEVQKVLVKRDRALSEKGTQRADSLDDEWARDVAPKVCSAADLMRRIGEYDASEEVLLNCVFGSRDDLPPDDAALADPALLDDAIASTLRYLDEAVEHGEAGGGCEGLEIVTGELARVSEEKRLSLHYFNLMVPWASRATHYAQRCVRSTRARGGVDSVEMQILLAVNHCWLMLSRTSLAYRAAARERGFRTLMAETRGQGEALRNRIRADDACALGKLQQLQATSYYCEAAYLLNAPDAVDCYDKAHECFEEALATLARGYGKESLQYAECAVELGICWGNRRRTADMRPRAKLMAARWYHRGYQIRSRLLGEVHPLTQRALRGYMAHGEHSED